MMQRVLGGMIVPALLVGCGVFGTADRLAAATPRDNAQPPVDGSPVEGVYVSTSLGDDDGAGTIARPLKTLKKAFALANEQKVRVIACAEVYEENLTLMDGVSAYGYFECAVTPWKRGGRRAIVKAPASPAVLARDLTHATRLDGFEIMAPDLDGTRTTEKTGSSVALEVRDSQGLVVFGSLLHGGKAAPGSAGVDGSGNSHTAASNGAPASDQTAEICDPLAGLCEGRRVPGPPGGVTTCAIGGAGGPGGHGGDGLYWMAEVPNTDASVEHRGRPVVATAATAAGGIKDGLLHGLPGQPGAAGARGAGGVNGVWSMSARGFVRGNGAAGGPGQPGQGGGGGGGADAWFSAGGRGTSPPLVNEFSQNATGGGGGAGGCPGQAGTGGTGGGASVGAFVVASGVAIEQTRIESSAGGEAGLGNLGSIGTTGGTGGAGTVHTIATTGRGGDGGDGGSGGGSGHGAAGPSIALVYSGARPVLTTSELVAGPGGAGHDFVERFVRGVPEGLAAAPQGESMMELEVKP